MNNYDVYGLGNALVDYEYSVSTDWLNQAGIAKGVMTLVDENQQQEIMSALGMPPQKRASGGSGANSVIALAQMGGNAFYSCRVATDVDGEFYARDMAEAGVNAKLTTTPYIPGKTGTCVALITEDADRTMLTYLGVTSNLDIGSLEVGALCRSKYLYIEGYLAASKIATETAIQAYQMAKDQGVKVALSLSDPSMVNLFKQELLALIGDGIDLLFANEDEAKDMAGTDNIDQAIEFMKTITESFVITRGATGSVVYDGHQCWHVPAVAIDAIDTLGAGDMYAGAFLYGITHNMSYSQAAHLASLMSAYIVKNFGPRLQKAQVQKLLKQFYTR